MVFKIKKWPTAPARVNLIWDEKQSLNGKHFVVVEEQGLGDIIQLYWYLRLLEYKKADVTFKIKPNLYALLQAMDSNNSLRKSFLKENAIDFESPLMSLSYLLNANLETIPETIPYLHTDQDETKTWVESLRKNSFKIGS